MQKKQVLISQFLLLSWFFLDMTGLSIGDKYLVTQSYQEDGIFFLIYLTSLVLFIFYEKIGKWLLTIYTFLWGLVQFLSHEWYLFFETGFMGTAQGKIRFYADSLHWLSLENHYIPDVYHSILHLLILIVFVMTALYIKRGHKKPKGD